jgi:hypothetical protein
MWFVMRMWLVLWRSRREWWGEGYGFFDSGNSRQKTACIEVDFLLKPLLIVCVWDPPASASSSKFNFTPHLPHHSPHMSNQHQNHHRHTDSFMVLQLYKTINGSPTKIAFTPIQKHLHILQARRADPTASSPVL